MKKQNGNTHCLSKHSYHFNWHFLLFLNLLVYQCGRHFLWLSQKITCTRATISFLRWPLLFHGFKTLMPFWINRCTKCVLLKSCGAIVASASEKVLIAAAIPVISYFSTKCRSLDREEKVLKYSLSFVLVRLLFYNAIFVAFL